MVIYEITAVVQPTLASNYEDYMIRRHMPDLLETGHFMSASMARNGERYRIRYEARSSHLLEDYLTRDSDRLRADFAEHFPEGVSVSREIWEVIASLDLAK